MGSTAKKRLGQNFLHDPNVSRRIVRALAPYAGATVIEIGPGRGALTRHLIEHAGKLITIELDPDLVPELLAAFGDRANFTLLQADALTVDFCRLLGADTQARVVANLPYYISTAILQHLIAQRACVPEMVLMLQREVVARLVAPPGAAERGYLSVLVEAYCEAEALFDVAPGAFRPVPKVWSTVVRLRVREQSAVETHDEALLWQLVSAGFAQRRKTIFNNLRHAPAAIATRVAARGGASATLAAAEIDPQRRAETLTLAEWSRLARALE